MSDRRKMNDIWIYQPHGQKTYYIFGRKGTGKNATIITLNTASTLTEASAKLKDAKDKYY